MPKRCIITDSTCILPSIPDTDQVPILTIQIPIIEHEIVIDDKPPSVKKKSTYSIKTHKLQIPTVDDFYQMFLDATDKYDEILGLFVSSGLISCFDQATKAVTACRGGHKIRLIDSLTTAGGLGLLVRAAHKELCQQKNMESVEAAIRVHLTHLYTLICTPDLTILQANNLVDIPQAVIGEMMELNTIFSIEDGFLTSVDKVRAPHLALEFFSEFINEFDEITNITFFQPENGTKPDLTLLKDQVSVVFPSIQLSEQPANQAFSALWGHSAFGLVLEEAY